MATRKNAPEETAHEVVAEVLPDVRSERFDDESLLAVNSIEDAVRLARQQFGDVANVADTLGDGFSLLDKKSVLKGVPVFFLEWTFNKSDKVRRADGSFSEFVSARVVVQGQQGAAKYIINDGGTGIYDQLRKYTERTGHYGGLYARNGLRDSVYEKTLSDGSVTEATTWYIDTSA